MSERVLAAADAQALLVAQLRAVRASIDATLVLLEGADGGQHVPPPPLPTAAQGESPEAVAARQRHLAGQRQDNGGSCPKCNAPRKARESNQGFGMTSSQARELCGVCGHVFENS